MCYDKELSKYKFVISLDLFSHFLKLGAFDQEVNMLSYVALGLALISFSGLSLAQDCPFGPGSCPVTLGNTVDVYFHDVADLRSCQRECNQIADCHFWTMKPDADSPTDHMKCFLFKTCDYLDPCDECISGPDLPLYDPDNCDHNGNFTCETSLDNVVDIYYFDAADTFSCIDQCKLLEDCHYYTQFDVTDDPQPHHKCFLFKDCSIHEPCSTCETGGPFRRFY